MATDQTEPRNNVILVFTALSALTLVILGPMFLSYYKGFIEDQVQKVVLSQPAAQYEETKSQALSELQNGRLPIEQAVETLAQQGRDASPLIEPRDSDDLGAVEGWGQAKNEAAAEAAKQAIERREAAAAEEAARQAAAAEASAGAGDEASGTGEAAADGAGQSPGQSEDALTAGAASP